MMKSNKTIREQKDSNLISFITFRFVPYWPLFALLLVIAAAGAIFYVKWTAPIYQAKANLLIKDENKGSDDSKMLESLNIFTTKKIIKDKIEALKSKTQMREVERNLSLYAPSTPKGRYKTSPAYMSSPVVVEA